LSAEIGILKSKFAELIGWERRKRHEQVFGAAFCISWALAILLLPLHVYLPNGALRWLVPSVLFVALAPYVFYRWCWQRRDEARAVVQLDKTLRLDERAITAWEISTRAEAGGAELLVLKQAQDKLHSVEPRRLFPRHWSWPAYLALPLLGLWFALLWLDVDRQFFDKERPSPPQSLAHKLREYSRELQEKAKSEGLRESQKMGQELEKVAQSGIEKKPADEQFKKEVAGVAKKFEAAAKSGADKDSFSAAESQQSLKDLKAELEAARDLMQLPDATKGIQDLVPQWMERLTTLPQLQRQLEREPRAGPGLGQNELKSFLDRLDKQVTGELDRRALLDAQQFLDQMMKQGQGDKGQNQTRSAAKGDEESPADGVKDKTHSNRPGKEPGRQEEGYRSLPELRAGASTQVKGLLGEGESSGITFKGKPAPGKSGLSHADVVASYRRQAEQELNSEGVPEGLKETIKNYFMSLGGTETKK
jgi:hypothetical protein